MKMLLHIAFALLGLAALPARSDDFLDPDEAFRFSVKALDNHTLQARWLIADGYYLYNNKFKFDLQGAKLGRPVLPAGKLKKDDTFGDVEVHRKEILIKLPVEREPGGVLPVTLKATYQGCADAGLCYTPITQTARLKLAALPAPATAVESAPKPKPDAAAPESPGPAVQSRAALEGLRSLNQETADPMDILPPEKAFKAEGELSDNQAFIVRYGVDPCCYLYRDRLKFVLKAPAGVSVDRIESPPGDMKDDPTLGKVEVYHHPFTAKVHLSRALATGEAVEVVATYQGCNEKVGICYPPNMQTLVMAGVPVPAAAAAASPEPEVKAAPPAPPTGTGSDLNRIEQVLKGGGFWTVMAAFFGYGLLLSLTPCVFPMIPILSGIIVGQQHVTKTKGFFLALGYVLGMAVTYAIAGVVAAESGTLISDALQNPLALGIGAAIFVALALSMFGFFELQLPSALQSKLTEASNKLHGGHMTGVFGMGALSALVMGPCVAPPLAAALAYIAKTGNMVLGGWALFTLALGMGVPLLAVGLSAGALLPKAGVWMNGVTSFFGVLMLGVAIWLISSLIPSWVGMVLWATLLIISAVYLHALDSLPPHASGWRRLWKGVGVVALIAGLSLVLGALGGSRDLLQPLAVYKGGLAGNAAAAGSNAQQLKFDKVKSVAELDARLEQARAAGKAVMLDFYADWCVSCKEMERFTFSNAKVQERLKAAVLLQADVTSTSDEDKALLKRFGLFGPPGIIFWTPAGAESGYKVIGYEPTEKFLSSIDQAFQCDLIAC
ncbi:MAG TPA: protein-disulfide reductase DsbD [Thiobacillaceae bacterium]|nr:protein-disulfide reductase DsbD [Thiobacillaceae bacterium]